MLLLAGGSAAGAASWHALVVGVDRYPGREDGAGAVASATDLAAVLRRHGTEDLTLLTDDAAQRGAVLAAVDALAARTAPGDTVLLCFDGLGARAASGELTADLLLPGAADPDHMISGGELAALVRRVEDRGGRAVLVLDASFGTAETRGRGAPPAGPPARLVGDPDIDQPFARSLVLASSDLRFRSRAVLIPGTAGPRRALTYAVARGLEGRADLDGDGTVSVPELVTYAARLVYQLTDQRQAIAAVWPRASLTPSATTRGIVIRATPQLGVMPPRAELPGADAPLLADSPDGTADRAPQEAGPPIRIAAATGAPGQLAGVAPTEGAVVAVARTDAPDLVWDPGAHDVITPDGDLIAENVGPGDLDGVVDRTLAVRALKDLVVQAPQQMAVLPSDDVQRLHSLVKVEIGNVSGRYLVLFNIRSDGAVQMLYPLPNDPPLLTNPAYTLPLSVNEPLGADQIVAVTAAQPLDRMGAGLTAMNGHKTPVAAVQLVRSLVPAGALVGSVGVFSGSP